MAHSYTPDEQADIIRLASEAFELKERYCYAIIKESEPCNEMNL